MLRAVWRWQAHKELEEARAQNAELRAALEEAQEENKQAQVKYGETAPRPTRRA